MAKNFSTEQNERASSNDGVKLFGVIISKSNMAITASVSVSDDNFGKKKKKKKSLITTSDLVGLQEKCDENFALEGDDSNGYLSDDLIQYHKGKAVFMRKRAKPWTEEEHRKFLVGMEKLGKGFWLKISKEYVTTRTPSQIASHAQKYFQRLTPSSKKRKRSIFDLSFEEYAVPVSPDQTEVSAESSSTTKGSSFKGLPGKNIVEKLPQGWSTCNQNSSHFMINCQHVPSHADYQVPNHSMFMRYRYGKRKLVFN